LPQPAGFGANNGIRSRIKRLGSLKNIDADRIFIYNFAGQRPIDQIPQKLDPSRRGCKNRGRGDCIQEGESFVRVRHFEAV
jgi:hypothetical protein